MKIFLKAVAAFALLVLAVWAIQSDAQKDLGNLDAAPPGNPGWRRSALWDDGKAELCAYDVTWGSNKGRALLALVKEPSAPEGSDALKLNHIRDLAAASGMATAEMPGDRTAPGPRGALPEDGLPASLRDYVAGPAPAALRILPSRLAGRSEGLKPAVYQMEKRRVAEGVEIRLTRGPSVLAYTFERETPFRLVRFERQDGMVYRLARCERIPYREMR
jgi:hypothetical protein